MKKILTILMVLIAFNINAADYKQAPPTALGMPGDNLNLYVVLNLFKQANSTEDFERMLNSGNYNANNLDLNNDGNIDYLRVTDYGNGNYHTIVIQDIISANETQDVAIIDLQRANGNVAHIQIIGDESLYGKNYIIEPQLENNNNTTIVNNNYYYNSQPAPIQYVNVWSWPCVSFIFNPGYSVWVSPWHWAYYPTWWNNRPRVIYTVYYSNFNNFGWNNYCRRNNYFNQTYYNNYCQQRRVVSNIVQVNINKNVYRNDYDHLRNNNYNNGYDKHSNNNHQENYPRNQNNNWNNGYNQQNGNWDNGKNQQKPNNNVNNNGQQSPRWNNNTNNNSNNGQQSPRVNNNGSNGNWNSNHQQNMPRNNNNNMNNTPKQQQNNSGGNRGGGNGGVRTGTRGR